MGKEVCRLRGRKSLDCDMVWYGGLFSEALWSNIFVDDELRISIPEGRKKTRSIKMSRILLLILPTPQTQLSTLAAELKKAPIRVNHQIVCTSEDSAPEKTDYTIALS